MSQGALARQGQFLRSSFRPELGLAGTALAEAIAVAVHLEDADVMCQPVEQQAGEAQGTEGFGPLVEGQIAGERQRKIALQTGRTIRFRGQVNASCRLSGSSFREV